MKSKNDIDERETRWRCWAAASGEGDRAAYNRLLSEVGDRARRYARSRVARSGFALDEAEDVVQEVLVAVHTKRDTWDAERPIGPWVDAIIRYKTLDALRRLGKRAATASDIDPAMHEVASSLSLEDGSRMRQLDLHLDALPSREQGVVAALGFEGLSAAKCAEKLGMTEVAVRVAFHRGLARLSRLVDAELGPTRTSR